MARTVNSIVAGTQLNLEADGRYAVVSPNGSTARLPAPAVAPVLLVDGWRSEEEIEHIMLDEDVPLPAGAVGQVFHALRSMGALRFKQSPWRPLEVRPWPAHRCQGCGACCQGHWIGPLEPSFVEKTMGRLEELRVKYPKLQGKHPFVRFNPEDPRLFLNSHGGQCLFLDEDMLCILHREYGVEEKPTICQFFPHVRLEDDVEMRLGISLRCIKHFDQVIEADPVAEDEHWVEMNDLLDGRLFHYYAAGVQEQMEGMLLAALPRSDDPLRDAIAAVTSEAEEVPGLGIKALQRLTAMHLRRLEREVQSDPLITQLVRCSGLFPRRVAELRGLAAALHPKAHRLFVPNSGPIRMGKTRAIVDDALIRMLFLRVYLNFNSLSHALAIFCMGTWTSWALAAQKTPGASPKRKAAVKKQPEDIPNRFGEHLATWIRTLEDPSVRRIIFESPAEVDAYLSAFRRFWCG